MSPDSAGDGWAADRWERGGTVAEAGADGSTRAAQTPAPAPALAPTPALFTLLLDFMWAMMVLFNGWVSGMAGWRRLSNAEREATSPPPTEETKDRCKLALCSHTSKVWSSPF